MFKLNWKNRTLDLSTPVVMGILNLTPDSFYDGGTNAGMANAVQKVEKMIGEGATIIDIGAFSTRPNAADVGLDEEWVRLKNPLLEIRKKFPHTILSVDTFRSEIAGRAADEGADMINDISGGQFDKKMFGSIARLKLPYVLMHIQGTPATMQLKPAYADVANDVNDFFAEQLAKLAVVGLTENVILDPGFGFGKTLEQNYEMLRRFSEFKKHGHPLLAGLSRKSMINKVLETTPKDALNGTSVLNTVALLNGANILRVHDVKPALEALKLVEELKRSL